MKSKLNLLIPPTRDAAIEEIINAYREHDREKLSAEFLNLLQSSDLLKILDEKKFNGSGTLREVLHVCSQLGKIDASLAWVVGVANSAWSMRSNFHSFQTANTAMEQNKILAMVLGRPGTLKIDTASNTYLLNGEWKYASAWPYSSFFFCLAVVENTVPKDIRVVAIPAEQLELVENWEATGLRGTQSATIRAKNILIKPEQLENYSQILAGKTQSQHNSPKNNPSYRGLFTGVLMSCLIGSILGATESALEYVTQAAKNQFPIAGSTYASMSDSAAIRAELGKLSSSFDLYKRAAEYNATLIDNATRDSNIILSVQERVSSRARATAIMRGCVDIVQDLLWLYGSSGLDKGHPLERIWRDVNVGARHGGFSKLIPEEALGLSILGRNPRDLTSMF